MIIRIQYKGISGYTHYVEVRELQERKVVKNDKLEIQYHMIFENRQPDYFLRSDIYGPIEIVD